MGNKVVILVNNKSVELIVSDKSKKIEFPSDVVQNQEISNNRKYIGMVTNFFNENNLVEEKVTILLSQEILYEKKISFSSQEEEEKGILDFLNTIPFENNKISFLKIPDDGSETIIAVNKELYTYLLDVCLDMKLKVEAVFPIKALGEIEKDAVSWKVIPSKLEKIENSSPYNFLIEAQGYVSSTSIKKYLIIALIFLLVTGLVAGGFYLLRLRGTQINKNQLTESKITTKANQANETTSSGSLLPRNQLSVEILNGTGTPGLAANLREQLLKLGYTIVETGNFEGTGSADTKVSFDKAISPDNQNEIINLLQKTFSNVISTESGQLNFNAVIITGQRI